MNTFLKKILLICSVLFFSALSAEQVHIVFVQLGPKLPPYISSSLSQAQLFNPDCDVYLITDKPAFLFAKSQGFIPRKTKIVFTDSLKTSRYHTQFNSISRLDQTVYKGLLRYSTERFFYLYEFMKDRRLENVIHLESDVMLYANVRELLPVFLKHYENIGALFDNEDRCIPSFCFFRKAKSLEPLVRFLVGEAASNHQDMQSIGTFKKRFSSRDIDNLPSIPPEYIEDRPLISTTKNSTKFPKNYCKYAEEFDSLFDAASVGQYLGGLDPMTSGPPKPGFINESSLFNPSLCEFIWEKDEKDRFVPYMVYNEKKYRMNNLHIHCKNLRHFHSLKKVSP